MVFVNPSGTDSLVSVHPVQETNILAALYSGGANFKAIFYDHTVGTSQIHSILINTGTNPSLFFTLKKGPGFFYLTSGKQLVIKELLGSSVNPQ
jgi:hypothetical protein